MVDAYICHTIDQGNKDFCAFVHLRVGAINLAPTVLHVTACIPDAPVSLIAIMAR
jgi:hypothetical protein